MSKLAARLVVNMLSRKMRWGGLTVRERAIRTTSDDAKAQLLRTARRVMHLLANTLARSALAQAVLAAHFYNPHEMLRHHARGAEVSNDTWE